jgi:hypothetical protein
MKIPSYVTVREFPSGRRYEVRLEVTGADGVRRQSRKRFHTLKEAVDAHATVTAGRAAGTFTTPSELTVKQACRDGVEVTASATTFCWSTTDTRSRSSLISPSRCRSRSRGPRRPADPHRPTATAPDPLAGSGVVAVVSRPLRTLRGCLEWH